MVIEPGGSVPLVPKTTKGHDTKPAEWNSHTQICFIYIDDDVDVVIIIIIIEITPWSRLLPEKLIVTQPRNSLPFMEPKVSSPCSQQHATGLCPEPDAFNPHIPNLFP
jgi:hypothetical protein